MSKKIKILWALLICHLAFVPAVCSADETQIFSQSVDPDALILLDLSNSMGCQPSDPPDYGPPECSPPANTSKLWIAQQAIKNILDANGDGQINSTDEELLGIRIGYMRFFNCSEVDVPQGGNPQSYVTWNNWPPTGYAACVTLQNPIPSTDFPPFLSPSRYIDIWNNVSNESEAGDTPLGGIMMEAKLYLDQHKSQDTQACRQRFVILITDGADSMTCGYWDESDPKAYVNRVVTVGAAAALYNAGYKVFVIGFGTQLAQTSQNTLNWAAYYGGTDNPAVPNSGNTGAITPSTTCLDPNGPNGIPSGNPLSNNPGVDPGMQPLSGYSFAVTDAASLNAALQTAFKTISNSRVSFTAGSVASSRTTTANAIYSASFQIIPNAPLWLGHVIMYTINADGSVGNAQWDAGSLLQAQNSSSRNIFTSSGGNLIQFTGTGGTDWNTWETYLGVNRRSIAQAIIGYIRGDSAYNPDNWKLGDIFHSNLVGIGQPSVYFEDPWDANHAFDTFRSSQQSRPTIIVAGANDGQFHAFNSGGNEEWSFIPPNLLPKLQYLAHSSNPTTLTHTYFVDGPVTVADVWLGSGNGTAKYASDWHTLLVFGEGRGVRDSGNKSPTYLWSSSPNCDIHLFGTYDPTISPYYCGYYALDVTNTGAVPPTFKWPLNPNPTQAPYLGEPWSKMAIGRVWYNGSEKWVGFIGAGYNAGSDSRGRGFFVVDLSDGNILWSFTSGMTYSIPGSPAIVDTDNDGFIDTAYVGDLGGNVWRFTFCTGADGHSCTWNGGKFFDATSGGSGPIYTAPSLAYDGSSFWVFWGTGDRENPNSTSGTDHFFALKDNDRKTIYTIGNLQNVSGTGTIYNSKSGFGWYITLPGTGEKNLSDSAVFGGLILFTTYIPPAGGNPCNSTGTSNLYAMAMMRLTAGGITYDPGAGVLTPGSPSNTAGGARSVSLGTGMAQQPVFSQKPSGGPTDLYISISGTTGGNASIIASSSSDPNNPLANAQPLNDLLKNTTPSTQILHWRDGRIQ